jgi:rhamnosyltransferase
VAVVRALRHLAIVTALAPGRRARLREAAAGLAAGWRGESGARDR